MVAVVAVVDHTYPVIPVVGLTESVTLPPAQNEVGPDAVMV